MSVPTLSHLDADGRLRMVDVSSKPATVREAEASGAIRMAPETLQAILDARLPKGDVLTVARVAGIQAAKRTAELIPLCHPLPLTDVDVVCTPDAALPGVRVVAVARTVGPTGVEMEAMSAVSVALLTIYDMAKAAQQDMVLTDVRLERKTGGRRGPWHRPDDGPAARR
jgi:cyclic pyranopterin phosphate synthase